MGPLGPRNWRILLVSKVRGSTGLLNVTVTAAMPGSVGVAGLKPTTCGPWMSVLISKVPRPTVAPTSFSNTGSNCRSTTGTCGSPSPRSDQVAPVSVDTKTPTCVPTYRRPTGTPG